MKHHIASPILSSKSDFSWEISFAASSTYNVTSISDIELHKPKIALQKFPDRYCGLQYSKVLVKRLYEICVIYSTLRTIGKYAQMKLESRYHINLCVQAVMIGKVQRE